MPFSAAVAVAYMIGMIIASSLFNRYVFPTSPRPLAERIKFFVIVNVAGIAQVWSVSMALVYELFPAIGCSGPLAQPLGHAVAIGVPTISRYFGHKLLTFKQS
jgi:putative flippase GtrA